MNEVPAPVAVHLCLVRLRILPFDLSLTPHSYAKVDRACMGRGRGCLTQTWGLRDMNRWITAAVRWAARISGLALVGLVLLFWIGEGRPANILRLPMPVLLEFAGTLLMLAGFLAGWRWPALGGCTAIAGFSLFLGTELAVNGKPPGGAFPLFLIPGVLLLISAGLQAALRKSAGKSLT